jgi:hypothetical protein
MTGNEKERRDIAVALGEQYLERELNYYRLTKVMANHFTDVILALKFLFSNVPCIPKKGLFLHKEKLSAVSKLPAAKDRPISLSPNFFAPSELIPYLPPKFDLIHACSQGF